MVSNVSGPVVQWYECRPRMAEVAGSSPARSTMISLLLLAFVCKCSFCVGDFTVFLLGSELVFLVFSYAWISVAD
jgi:hypothetical protein